MQTGGAFSQELKKLMQSANLKNATVAAILGYDISYVSKWISGGRLPSPKNISDLIDKLVTHIVKSADNNLYQRLCTTYQIGDGNKLEEEISEILFVAYKNDNREKEKGVVIGPKVKCYLTYPYNQLIGDIKRVLLNNHDLICMINLLDMSRELKLRFLGIKNGYFEVNNFSDIHILYLILNLNDRNELSDEDFYNALYLAHLLTRFSNINEFEIFSAFESCGKVILLADNYYFASALVFGTSRECMSYMISNDRVGYEHVFEAVKQILTQENMIFSRIELVDFRKTHEYQKIFVSFSTKCLIGHIPEFLLPSCIAEQMIDKRSKEYESWVVAHKIISRGNNVELLVYETAISEFMLDGRIDVFGKIYQINISDRIKVIEYLLTLLDDSRCSVRLILGGFYEDFLHLPNPCIFLSDLVCYLRVDNGSDYCEIYSAIHSSLKKLYHYFFNEAWNNRKGLVVSDKESIMRRLRVLMYASYAISSSNEVIE